MKSDHHHNHFHILHSNSFPKNHKNQFNVLKPHNPDAKILAWMYKGIRKAYQWRKLAKD